MPIPVPTKPHTANPQRALFILVSVIARHAVLIFKQHKLLQVACRIPHRFIFRYKKPTLRLHELLPWYRPRINLFCCPLQNIRGWTAICTKMDFFHTLILSSPQRQSIALIHKGRRRSRVRVSSTKQIETYSRLEVLLIALFPEQPYPPGQT